MALRWIVRSLRVFVGCLVAFLTAVPAVAQTVATGRWTAELHVGGVLPGATGGGTATIPPPGESLATAGIYGPPAPRVIVVSNSRRVSSWYFGDGAVLFDQAATAVAANPVAMTAPFPGRIVALDPVLGTALGDMRRGGSIGARVSRD